MHTVNEREFDAVLALPGEKRYAYTIKRIVDAEVVWSIRDENGWRLFGSDDSGRECVPIWPKKEFAELCCVADFANSAPASIDLDEWRSKWLAGMSRDGRLVAVFPTPANQSVVVEPQRLQADIDRELERY